MTEWREIPGWEGLYAVSDDGQVKSLPRLRRSSERIMIPQKESPRPYWFVTLWIGKHPFHRRIHNLMLEAFVSPRPSGMMGLHNDDDPDNNTLSNLRWGTRSDNSYDMIRNGNHNHARKTHCKWGHPLEGDNLILTKKQRFCRTCKQQRQAEYYRRQPVKPKAMKICPACGTKHQRRSKFCSDTCYTRAWYRNKAGTPIDAPLYMRTKAT